MNTQIFYIPTSRNKLAHFFGRGVIVPSKYLENSQKDIQNRLDDYIIFSKSKFTTETDCCIEVVLDAKEAERVTHISNSFSILDRPLAISRVTAIYFRTEEERDTTIHNVTKENGDAFIPERLCHIVKNESGIEVNELNGIKYKANPKDWSPELKRFNQLMGGFALMKIHNKDESYTPEYFQALSNINNYFSPSHESDRFKSLLAREDDEVTESISELYRDLVFSSLNPEDVVNFSQKENIKVSKKFGDIDIESISENTLTYTLAVLATYESYGGGKKVDDFLSNFIAGEFHNREDQELLLVFGINKGYQLFRNSYTFSRNPINVKFKLERKVDYYVIESIYQNIFNLNNSYDPVDIIEAYQELPYEYYDPLAGEVLEVKKKRRTGFFALLPIFTQKFEKNTENYTELSTKVRKVVSSILVSTDVLFQKINKLQERLDQGAKYVKQSEDRLTQKIKRIDDQSTKSEEALTKLKSEVQNNYASKSETADLKQAIDKNITNLNGHFTREIERIDDASTKSEETLTELKLEVQNHYVSKTVVDQAIEKNITAFDERFTREIERIDNASTKFEESLASIRLETQENYDSKTEIDDLKQTIESSYLSRQEVDDLMKLMAQDISKSVSGLKTQLEASIELNSKQEETITALNNKIDDLEIRFKNLEQKSAQPIRYKASKGQLKNKTSDKVESEIGDLFEDDSEPLNEERVKELMKLKRTELDNIAKNYGLTYNSYRTKSDIASAIAYWEASNDHDD